MNKAIYAAMSKVFAVVAIVFGAGAIFGGNFAHGYVTSQLEKEKIAMPAQENINRIKNEESRKALEPYIGEDLLTGPQTQVFANNYIWEHMMAASGGKTYEEVSGAYSEAERNGTMSEEELAKADKLRQTMFMGNSVRGMLLSAYGWWLVGTVAIWAGAGLIVGGIILAILGWGVLRPKKAGVEVSQS